MNWCDCKEHGHILLPSGQKSDEFCSKEVGYIVLDLLKNQLSEEELMLIAGEIARSSLPLRQVDEMPDLTFGCLAINTCERHKTVSINAESPSKYAN